MRVFGRGWDRHPTLSRFAAGEIANGYDLRCAYQAATINLQVNGYGSLHQRLLDCVASGGFVLVRYNPTDVLRRPWEKLRTFVRLHGIGSIDELMVAGRNCEELADVLGELTSLGVPCLDPERRDREQEMELMRRTGVLPDEMLGEEGYFEGLANMHGVPPRVANDIPGFAELTFRSRSECHGLLDEFVGNPERRRSAITKMRESVIQHDTYDVLAGRVMCRLEEMFGEQPEKVES